MKSLATLPNNSRVIIRTDYNVPLKGTTILDPRRIEASYDTIRAVLKKGCTPLLLAHLGKGQQSLRPIATYLSKTFKVVFITADITESKTHDIVAQVPKGTVILFENIRRYQGEEKNTTSFAKALARYGDCYVNDAFSVSHRAHASVVGITKHLPSFAGMQLEKELKSLSTVFDNKKHPSICILGGAKFGTKIPLLKQFVAKADKVVIAGAILNNFYRVAGFEIGKSVVEDGFDTQIKNLLKNDRILLPVDVLVVRKGKTIPTTPAEIEKSDVIVDIGPQSVELIATAIQKAKLVVWNGPTGWYEKGFTKATTSLAETIIKSRTKAIIGGGDTGAVIDELLQKNKDHKNIFVSTGGGATLDFLATGTLVGIKALV